MYNNIDNSNSILIDTTDSKSKNIKRKINCVICFPKVELTCVNPEENRYRCPRCKNDYQLGFRDIVPEEEELGSSHDSDDEGIGLLCSEDEFKSDNNEESNKTDIKVPKYMQPSPGVTVEYRED